MASRLALSPVHYFSFKFRVLHLQSLYLVSTRSLSSSSSSSFSFHSCLHFAVRALPPSRRLHVPSTFGPHLCGLRVSRQFVAASFSSDGVHETYEEEEPQEARGSKKHDLSSGFLPSQPNQRQIDERTSREISLNWEEEEEEEGADGEELNWLGEGERRQHSNLAEERRKFISSKLSKDLGEQRRSVYPSSSPSIPGRFSKYSRKGQQENAVTNDNVADSSPFSKRSSPSFPSKAVRAKLTSSVRVPESVKVETAQNSDVHDAMDFVPDVIKPDLPYIYSYSETPKVAPIGFREPLFSPFGPKTMARPWTGRPPQGKSKKKLPDFDSFKPPPPGKKGVKHVQLPGPFPQGEGPKLGRSREEILGEPLSKGEIKELVERAQKESRQLNLGA